MAATPLSSIRADIARLEANIQALTDKINRIETIEPRSAVHESNLTRWCKERTQYETDLKEARDKERQELLRTGGVGQVSDVVSVTFVPVATEKGHPQIPLDINRHMACSFAELKQSFVLESPNFDAETLSFKTNQGPIESDSDLRALLGSENSATIFYSIGQQAFSDWKSVDQIINDAKIAQDFNFPKIQCEGLNAPTRGLCARMRETFDVLVRRVGNPARTTLLSEAAKRLFVNAVLLAVIECFPAELRVSAEQLLQGSLGRGPVDYLLKYRDSNIIIVTAAKKDDIDGCIAQNVAQLKATSEAPKRKRDMDMYGIVTDSLQWVFLKLNANGDAFARSKVVFLELEGPLGQPTSTVIFQWVHAIISIQIKAVEAEQDAQSVPKKANLQSL